MAATSPVGATPGELEITTRGSAHYTIPIVVAPGTREMQPKLSLVYDSQASNGFIGHAWSLAGLSVIHRCGATILLDGFKGGVKYDGNDRFCLDSERLVGPVDAGDNFCQGRPEYRTRHETWQRICASDTSSNPGSFTVYAKDGYVLEFGVTEDSRIQAQGSAAVRVWALNKMTDRLGNYYTIGYQEDNANGDYRPDRIDYTGNVAQGLIPYNSVVFQYETRSDTPPRYEGGSVMISMQRLSRIQSYADATLARDYRLAYDNSGAGARSRLTSVQECGTDGVCLPATQFGWQNDGLGYAAAPIQFYWGADKANDAPIGFADINGDGQLDFYGWHSDGKIHVRFWEAGGFGADKTMGWSTNKSANGPVGFADINGDGRADFWGWLANGNIRVRMSNGDGTFGVARDTFWNSSKEDNPVGFADINGDGRADFYGWSSNGNVYVRLSNGDGTFGSGVATSLGASSSQVLGHLSFADVNGDGKADLIDERLVNVSYPSMILSCGNTSTQVYRFELRNAVRLSNANGAFSAESTVMSWYAYYQLNGMLFCYADRMPLGDVNGDGNADVFAWLAKGDGNFVAPPTSFFPTTGGSIALHSGLADLNGDGKDEYWYWDQSSGYIQARLSFGDSSFPGYFAIFWSTNSNDGPVGFADINGDGIADFYGWRGDGNIEVRLGSVRAPDLIVSITNSLGEQRQLSYKPLTDDSIYAPVLGVSYPYREIRDATYVVHTASKSDGLGGLVSTSYLYGARLKHVTANENLGFAWIQRVEPDGSWINDFYNQDIDLFGTLRESQTLIPGDVMVKRVTNDWRLGTSSYNRILIRLFGSTEETRELDDNLINRTTTTTEYDGYGYPTNTVVLQNDERKKTTVNAYFHDETYWTLGLKLLEQITAEAPGFTPQTRTTDFGYYTGVGLLAYERIEPANSALTLTTTYGYDAFGNRMLKILSGSNIVSRAAETLTYDTRGQFVTTRKNALDHPESFSYDARTGAVVTATGANNITTAYTYDGFGRKTDESRPGTPTTMECGR